jgi:hypothetical protein
MLRLPALRLLALLFLMLLTVSPSHAAPAGAPGRSNSVGVQVMGAVGTHEGGDVFSLAGLQYELGFGPHWAISAGARQGRDVILGSGMLRRYDQRGRSRFFGVGVGQNEWYATVPLAEVGLRVPLGRLDGAARVVGGYDPLNEQPLVLAELSGGLSWGRRTLRERTEHRRGRWEAWVAGD